MNRRLDAATQIAVSVLKTLRICVEEVLEVMGESPVEYRAFGTAWTIELGTRCGGGRLHSEE